MASLAVENRERADTLASLQAVMLEENCHVVLGDSETRPALTALHPVHGVIALDVVSAHNGARVELNRKVQAFRADFPDFGETPISRVVVALDLATPVDDCIDRGTALSTPWWQVMPERPVDPALAAQLASALAPTLVFHSPRRGELDDDGQEVRVRQRVVLDRNQAAIAQRRIKDVLVVSGPPGSGKSLVLAARARWLAERHPNWHIEVVCFNKLLVPYLADLLAGTNAHVGRMSEFMTRHNIKMSFDLDGARGQLAEGKRKAMPIIDALLVDEWQDLHAPFIQLLLEHVFPGRGGALLVGDPGQALYGEVDEDEALRGHNVERVELLAPYRSTRQILEVAAALDPGLDIAAKELGLDGQPVDIVFANDKGEQAAAIARDIKSALDSGGRAPENVAVLVLRKWDVGVVAKALEREDIPFEVVRKEAAAVFELSAPKVKIFTAHSAKGYEFDLVLLMGIEQLPSPDEDEGLRHGRSALVGLTRAKDQVVITYSKENVYLNRLRALPPDLVRPWVWPDDYAEV